MGCVMQRLFKSFLLAALLLLAVSPAFALSLADPAANWAGAYALADVGGTWGNFFNGPTGTGGNASGVVAGGYNWQVDHLVLGGESDISGIHVPARSTATQFDEDWMMSFRARVGYSFGRYLPYATAGVGMTSTTWTVNAGGSSTNVRPGATVGGGLDAIISGNWFGRAEYLYTNVPNRTVHVGATTLTGGSDNSTVRVGIGYKF